MKVEIPMCGICGDYHSDRCANIADDAVYTCSHCGERGHLASECPRLKSPPADVLGTIHKTPSPATYTQAFNLASGERVVMHLYADKVIPPDDYFVDETVQLIMQAQKEERVRHYIHVLRAHGKSTRARNGLCYIPCEHALELAAMLEATL